MKKKLMIALAAMLVICLGIGMSAFKNKAQHKVAPFYYFYFNGTAWVVDTDPSSFPPCLGTSKPCRAKVDVAQLDNADQDDVLNALNDNIPEINSATATEDEVTDFDLTVPVETDAPVQVIITERS